MITNRKKDIVMGRNERVSERAGGQSLAAEESHRRQMARHSREALVASLQLSGVPHLVAQVPPNARPDLGDDYVVDWQAPPARRFWGINE